MSAPAPRDQPPPPLRQTVRSLRHRNYRLFFAGQLVSLVGTWVQMVAQSWLVYRLTRSEALLGAVGFAGQVPILLLAPLGGALADRVDRRRLLVLTQAASLLSALFLAVLTLLGHVTVWHVAAAAVALGAVNAVDIPTRQAFVPSLVERDDLVNAIALNSTMFNGARVVGPAIAGLLVASVGEGWCFAVNAASFLAVITGLLLMDVPRRAASPPGAARDRLTAGFRFAWRTVPVRAILLLLGAVSLTGMPYTVLMPIFADQVLHGGARGLGLLMSASGIGALAGAVLLAARRDARGLGTWAAAAAAGFGVCLVLFAASRSFWLSAALLVPTGFSMIVQMASTNTLVQTLVPDELRGRVMAVYSVMFLGMAPFGALAAGFLAERVGAPVTVAAGGAVCTTAALLFASRLPSLREQAGL